MSGKVRFLATPDNLIADRLEESIHRAKLTRARNEWQDAKERYEALMSALPARTTADYAKAFLAADHEVTSARQYIQLLEEKRGS